MESTIKYITIDDVKQMTDIEGLVLEGCGGDINEWVEGITEMLRDDEILLYGDTFKNISVFNHNDITSMIFHMDDVSLDYEKLPIWRLKTKADFGSTWLSDYLVNRLGINKEMSEEMFKEISINEITDKKTEIDKSSKEHSCKSSQDVSYEYRIFSNADEINIPKLNVEDLDIPKILLKLHAVYNGNIASAVDNLKIFDDNTTNKYLLFVNQQDSYLAPVIEIYKRGSEASHFCLNLMEEKDTGTDTKIFAIDISEQKGIGRLIELDNNALYSNIKNCSILPSHIETTMTDGSKHSLTLLDLAIASTTQKNQIVNTELKYLPIEEKQIHRDY